MNNDVYRKLSLAMRAGKVQSGGFQTEQTIKSEKAALVILAEDASDNTKKQFRDMCAFRKVPWVIYGTKEALGHSIGKEERSCLCVTDEGFRKMIEDTITKEKELNGGGNR